MNEELKVIIKAEVGKFKEGIQSAKKQIEEFTKKGEDGTSKMDAAFKKVGSGIQTASKAMAKGIAAVATALATTTMATIEYRDDMAKLDAAYKSANLSTEAAKTAYADLYRVLGETDQAVEASQQIALLADSEKEVAQWSELAAGVVGTFGDALQPETFYEAANETLKLGEATGAYVQMLEGTGQSVDEFNKGLAACKTEGEKQAYMLEYTKKALGTAGAEFEKTNAKVLSQRDAQMKLQESLAKVGDALTPVLTAFTAFGAEALAVCAPYLQSFAENYLPLIKDLLSGIADALAVAFEWASQHKELLAGLAIAIGIVVTAIGLYNAVTAVKAAMVAMEVASVWGLVAAYTAQGAAMLVAIAPYVAVVAAIAAVIAIIVLCVKHWDKIKKVVKETWQNIKTNTANNVKEVVNQFNNLKDKAVNKVNDLKSKAVDKFNSIKSGISNAISNAKSNVVNGFGNMKDGAVSRLNSLKSAAVSVFNSVKSSITEKINAAKNAVSSAISKIKSIMNFKWSLPKLKLPRINISGKFSLSPPSVPKFSISWNALGGVFTKPTVMPWGNSLQGLGEAGAEAVVPLEKNTYWLDKIAEKITAKTSGGQPIVMEVDGKVFAEVAIDSINALTRQNRRLGLNIV